MFHVIIPNLIHPINRSEKFLFISGRLQKWETHFVSTPILPLSSVNLRINKLIKLFSCVQFKQSGVPIIIPFIYLHAKTQFKIVQLFRIILWLFMCVSLKCFETYYEAIKKSFVTSLHR